MRKSRVSRRLTNSLLGIYSVDTAMRTVGSWYRISHCSVTGKAEDEKKLIKRKLWTYTVE